jgi:hypothetical protein
VMEAEERAKGEGEKEEETEETEKGDAEKEEEEEKKKERKAEKGEKKVKTATAKKNYQSPAVDSASMTLCHAAMQQMAASEGSLRVSCATARRDSGTF